MKAALRNKVLDILGTAKDMSVATLREDGFPHNTTVTFVNDGLIIYFACAANSQKALNLKRDTRMSATLTAPYTAWREIRGLSLSARAARVTDVEDMKRVGALIVDRYPEAAEFANAHPDDIAFFAVSPEVVSVLDYTLEFGHSDQVIVSLGDIVETSARKPHIWLPKGA